MASDGMLLVEIVTHVYSGPGAQYAHFLRYQIDSLFRFPPQRVEAMLTVIYPEDDKPTHGVLEEYRWPVERALMIRPCPRPRSQALKRPIGRNERALSTRADWVCRVMPGLALLRVCFRLSAPPVASMIPAWWKL